MINSLVFTCIIAKKSTCTLEEIIGLFQDMRDKVSEVICVFDNDATIEDIDHFTNTLAKRLYDTPPDIFIDDWAISSAVFHAGSMFAAFLNKYGKDLQSANFRLG